MRPAKTVLFLQNAWSPAYAGGTWPRRSWLAALEVSRSGQRLRLLIDDFDICENTTPIVGADPDSVVAVDDDHIKAVLERRRPRVVIACGKQAEAALVRLWPGPLLALPHPANRVLTSKLYEKARALLKGSFSDRIALRQTRSGILLTTLPAPSAIGAPRPSYGVLPRAKPG